MLTIDECMEFCDLNSDELDAIAMHEHIPFVVAIELGTQLVKSKAGLQELFRMVREDIEHARLLGHDCEVCHWQSVYQHLQSVYPAIR